MIERIVSLLVDSCPQVSRFIYAKRLRDHAAFPDRARTASQESTAQQSNEQPQGKMSECLSCAIHRLLSFRKNIGYPLFGISKAEACPR
jgi:hypothetical protein